LYTVRIAGEKEAASLLIPNSEGEHSAQPVHHIGAVARVKMKERFCIRSCAEMRTIRFKLDPQLRVVVDLPVKHDDETAIVTAHRLRCAVGQIEDGEASVSEPAT